jgi:energy-coupling factor transporter transmembrane protein EcfT
MLIPLVICTVRRSMRLAEAMEARAFGSAKQRTSLKDLRMERGDYALITATLVLFTLGALLQLAWYGLIRL